MISDETFFAEKNKGPSMSLIAHRGPFPFSFAALSVSSSTRNFGLSAVAYTGVVHFLTGAPEARTQHDRSTNGLTTDAPAASVPWVVALIWRQVWISQCKIGISAGDSPSRAGTRRRFEL